MIQSIPVFFLVFFRFHFFPLILNMSVEKSTIWGTLTSFDSSQVESSQHIVICMSYELLNLEEVCFASHKTK